ncbi:glycoside hydrolase family 38 C-terminal domain-containing protein [Clavibacter tessellarius]|uniref:glycoside hydrolase family 38 C-terminal domain-containing protein n=1 Tax=Clavibacter tessellarius TaxID=31965 RepID=UPI0039BF4484
MTDVDWHERQKLLKLAFPLDVHADRAASEVQFGHVQRVTHANTSWETARFETVAHRWVHVGEPGFGVAVANDATYGHDVTRIPVPTAAARPSCASRCSGRPCSRIRTPTRAGRAALRGARGADVLDAADAGYRLNLPVREIAGDHGIAPLVTSSAAVVIEAVKLAEDRSGDLVVRLYEARGGREHAVVRVDAAAGLGEAHRTDLLERPLAGHDVVPAGEGVAITLRPFEIATLRFARR